MYILLRHSEKENGVNPSLSDIGQKRAIMLARMFGECNKVSIYSTGYRRTKQTAQPLSEATGQTTQEYDRNELESLVEELSQVKGAKIVIGHSTTTLQLLELLTGIAGDPIDEDTEFDRLYIFSRDISAPSELLQMRYGEK